MIYPGFKERWRGRSERVMTRDRIMWSSSFFMLRTGCKSGIIYRLPVPSKEGCDSLGSCYSERGLNLSEAAVPGIWLRMKARMDRQGLGDDDDDDGKWVAGWRFRVDRMQARFMNEQLLAPPLFYPPSSFLEEFDWCYVCVQSAPVFPRRFTQFPSLIPPCYHSSDTKH